MPTVNDICEFLEQLAPQCLAESWDNVGLLVGRRASPVRRIMACLTVTPESTAEATAAAADLIVSHHPLPFRPLNRVTDETTTGRLLLDLIAAGIAVYSPHTAFDSAGQGINQQLAEGLELAGVQALVAREGELAGAGRRGELDRPITVAAFAARVKRFLRIEQMQCVGDDAQPVQRVAVACGAAGEFLDAAASAGCEGLVLGETNLHTCLEAQARGVALFLTGHHASERFAVEQLAETLARQFPDAQVWASRDERDPVRFV